MTGGELADRRLEIENRIRNLFWTVSGDYSMDIQPDADMFALSKPMALYHAIRQGAFTRHFDLKRLALYILKKRDQGAEEGLLLELARLCIDAAAYPLVCAERSGVAEIRRQAFADCLRLETVPEESREQTLCRIRQSLMRRFLGEPDACPPELLRAVGEIENLSRAVSTDDVIRKIDGLYDALFAPDGEKTAGERKKAPPVPPEELTDYQRYQALSDDRIQTVLDEYLSVLKQEMLRMRGIPRKAARRPASQTVREEAETEPDPTAAEKVYAYMERNFGKSYLTPLERERLNRKLCVGIHSRCSLYFTDGILQNPALKSTQYLRGQMQNMKNELYVQSKQRAIRRNIDVLAGMLKRVRILRLDEDTSRADAGRLNMARLWKLGRTDDGKLFDAKKKREDAGIVVDILLDGSSSQTVRQPQIAAQGFIISQALSKAGIPHRVSGFCSFWDYTILHRFRDYDDPPQCGKNILQFRAIGENRDGLAIRTVCTALRERGEESKILIILSDGRPNHLGFGGAGSRKPAPYVGEEAVRDTALEVRKARNMGISVLGIFVGDEEDLCAEKRIFGREFTYIRNISSFSRIVGAYLCRQMEDI